MYNIVDILKLVTIHIFKTSYRIVVLQFIRKQSNTGRVFSLGVPLSIEQF